MKFLGVLSLMSLLARAPQSFPSMTLQDEWAQQYQKLLDKAHGLRMLVERPGYAVAMVSGPCSWLTGKFCCFPKSWCQQPKDQKQQPTVIPGLSVLLRGTCSATGSPGSHCALWGWSRAVPLERYLAPTDKKGL